MDCASATIDRRRDMSAGGVEFVPFSIEAGGVWGPAAKKFFRECLALADDDRDIDLYHWSSSKFSASVARHPLIGQSASEICDTPIRLITEHVML